MHETIEKGVLTEHRLTLVAQDGRQVPLLLNGSVFRDPAGNVGGVGVGSCAGSSIRPRNPLGAKTAMVHRSRRWTFRPAHQMARYVWTRCGTGNSPTLPSDWTGLEGKIADASMKSSP